MKLTSEKLATLADDIRKVIVQAHGEKLEMIRLCRDHSDPFMHHDKKAILNITQDEFVGIFDLKSNHYFLLPEQVFRLGAYCKLALPNLIAFMLKAEWECFLSEMAGYPMGSGIDLQSLLNDQHLIERYSSDFKPNSGKYFNLIKDISYIPNTNITYGHIDFFINDLIEKNSFLIENKQIGNLYPEKDITEKLLLHNISDQQRDSYFRMKELWKVKSSELDELLLRLEQGKRLNLNIENKYYKTFGKLETEKSRFRYRVEKYKIILELMREQPELTYRELNSLAGDKMIEADRERNELTNKITRSLNNIEDIIPQASGSIVSAEFRNSYMQACKKLLRKLFFLLHSDTCPNYSELSGQKKAEVNKLWLELMKSTKDELYSFSPTMLLYSLPNYEQLESIYIRACEILEINPDDFELGNRLEFMIRKGAPFKTIVEFLISETEKLELHLAHLELVINEYTQEDQSQIYKRALEDIDTHSEKMKNDVTELKKQIKRLKIEILNGQLKIV